jgi:hypothetical protein
VSIELQSNVSETVSASIIRIDVMDDMTTRCIYIHYHASVDVLLMLYAVCDTSTQ